MVPSFEHACSQMTAALAGPARHELAAAVSDAPRLGPSLLRLRESLAANTIRAGGTTLHLDKWVTAFDQRTRAEGFHALHDWDGVRQRVNPDSIPVDVLDFIAGQRAGDPVDPAVALVLIDYYYMHLLSLLSLRVWDEGDPNENLDRVQVLLDHLQGPDGSGHRFAESAETLILIATAHYERNESGYFTLLDQVRRLDAAHQARVAIGHAQAMGCHLRFGFEAQCGRDTVLLRSDNVADYPWLSFALAKTMSAYRRLRASETESRERRVIVEALLNGLTPDARAFVGASPPASLSGSGADLAEFLDGYRECRDDLLREFEAFRPTEAGYSPLAFYFNFSHNVVKGTAIDALLWGKTWPVSLDDLFTSVARSANADEAAAESTARLSLAHTLMAYARLSPDRIRGRLMPVIVYDIAGGRQAYSTTLRKLTE